MTYELRFIARCEELGEAAVRDKVNTGPQLPLGTVLRAATLMLAATALFGLTGCKSLPTGSFELLNTPAMKVAKLTPPITVSVEDRRAFIKDNDVVGMAISGGGMRASAFTLGVFAGLEEITKKDSEASALDRVDFASANSGGSWALAALLANLRADPAFSPRNDYQHYADTFKLLNKSSTRHWAEAMEDAIGPNATMGAVRFIRPRAFFNASILQSQDPFVFTKEFSEGYRVDAFYARGRTAPFGQGGSVNSLPLGYVAATSGSVPGFTHSFAHTALCSGPGELPSFCGRQGNQSWLRLVDGGLYDNEAYKTAWEVARAVERDTAGRQVMFLVDSKGGWPIPTTGELEASQHDGLIKAGTLLMFKGSFPLQEATYRRLAPQMFDAIGYQTILLDFDAASGFHAGMEPLVEDLPQLQAMAADEIDCIDDNGQILKANARRRPPDVTPLEWLKQRGGDCLENNFARVGYHHQTTYFYDPRYFASTYQLGVLVARRKAADIRAQLGLN